MPTPIAAAVPTEDLIAALRRPQAYPHPVGEVGFLRTHISLLFFAGERVYKVKKPVNLGFVDYSTLELRRHFCHEEVRLNRRLAPDVYLGVAEIRQAADGVLRIDGSDGEIVEYAVVMRRLPQERMLDRLLEQGQIDNQQINALAELLVRFHRDSRTGPGVDEYAAPDELRRQVEEEYSQLSSFTRDSNERGDEEDDHAWTLSSALQRHLRGWAVRFLADNRDLLEQRVRQGRIREGHGDLHAGNICLTDPPQGIVIYDCIEFTPRFRCRDVACEVAFLAMDLDCRGYRGFASFLAARYAESAGDPPADMQRLMRFYKTHLAVIRGKVTSIRSIDPGLDDAARNEARREAMGYFHLAAAYTLGPALILMCGLPGSGKSWGARHIAKPFEAVLLHSDAIRKELAGLAPTARPTPEQEAELYSDSFTRRTYAALMERARHCLEQGRTVIADATFPTAARRRTALKMADLLKVPALIVEAHAPPEAVRQRMAARAGDVRQISDADWQVYLRMRHRFERPNEVPWSRRITFGPHTPAEELVSAVIDILIAT